MISNKEKRVFPKSFQNYKPRSHKVFGVVCSTLDGKYLLVRGRTGKKWSFPKGHMERGETALQCAKRELYEECGIRVVSGIGYNTSKFSRNKDGNNAEYFYYTVPEELPVSIQDTNEIDSAKWFTLEEIQYLNGNIDVTNFLAQKGYPRLSHRECAPTHPT
jgi:8-oxo-dGTP pyrophosphatase MutT (NUDIX family)